MKDHLQRINIKQDRAIINVLGEVCWGFQIDNFEEKIGAKKEIVEAFLKRLLREEKAGVVETHLNEFEVKILRKALSEVEKEIEEWEFETRIGIPLKNVKEITN